MARAENPYDAIVLDLMLPDVDGFAVCRGSASAADDAGPHGLARDAVRDRVAGLDAGADDYLTKPFSPPTARAPARADPPRRDRTPPVLRVGDLSLDPAARSVARDGQAIELTAKEYALLEFFMRHPGGSSPARG